MLGLRSSSRSIGITSKPPKQIAGARRVEPRTLYCMGTSCAYAMDMKGCSHMNTSRAPSLDQNCELLKGAHNFIIKPSSHGHRLFEFLNLIACKKPNADPIIALTLTGRPSMDISPNLFGAPESDSLIYSPFSAGPWYECSFVNKLLYYDVTFCHVCCIRLARIWGEQINSKFMMQLLVLPTGCCCFADGCCCSADGYSCC